MNDSGIIEQTKTWLKNIVIGLGFCPFARGELMSNRIHYFVDHSKSIKSCLESLILECERLDQNQNIATSLIIYSNQWAEFDAFLDYLALAETLLDEQNYKGIYQLASFHPDYCFEGSTEQDAANFTNRSPYPMLHLLREDQLEAAIMQHPDTEQIPHQNIQRARALGLAKLVKMLEDCC